MIGAEQALAHYAPQPPAERPFVALNMIAALDGAASVAGRTAGLANAADRELFHALRGRFDAVMAGAGTVRAERYGPLIRGAGPQPYAVIPSASLRLDPALPLLNNPGSRVLILTPSPGGELAPCAARVEYVRNDSLAEALAILRGRYAIDTLLCEGGPQLNSKLFAEDLVDELFLSLAPTLLGAAEPLRIVAGEIPRVDLELRWLLESESHLYARYAVSRVSSATAASSSLAS
ncbi:MAG: hypothetical protein NVSMB51_05150 [Solirubrobacteraceae bacterium]